MTKRERKGVLKIVPNSARTLAGAYGMLIVVDGSIDKSPVMSFEAMTTVRGNVIEVRRREDGVAFKSVPKRRK